MSQVTWLNSSSDFPSTSKALSEPNGLLAAGGDLSTSRIITAYKKGIFPWYSEGQPILWWSPSPRMVLIPSELHIGRSNRKLLRNNRFTVTLDSDFRSVIERCATISRNGQDGTWITDDMMESYIELHDQGVAHSVECWEDSKLVGGLYGIVLGKVFFGESMFSCESGASKFAFMKAALMLANRGFQLIDCQQHTDYLKSFGAREVSRTDFEYLLVAVNLPSPNNWNQNWDRDAADAGLPI